MYNFLQCSNAFLSCLLAFIKSSRKVQSEKKYNKEQTDKKGTE